MNSKHFAGGLPKQQQQQSLRWTGGANIKLSDYAVCLFTACFQKHASVGPYQQKEAALKTPLRVSASCQAAGRAQHITGVRPATPTAE